jgi:acylaminoacyl-peptidase
LTLTIFALVFPLLIAGSSPAAQDGPHGLEPLDIFQLEWISDPQISPDGERVVYARNFNDIMTDGSFSNLWIVNFDGTDARPLTTGNQNDFAPRWSPDGTKLLYASARDGGVELWLRWMDTGQTAKLTNLTESPYAVHWSPDGQWIAFTMFVPEAPESFVSLPPKPEGAEWAAPAKVITRTDYRADGAGYTEDGYQQIFVLAADGGTPRQITWGPYHQGGTIAWSPGGESLIFSANRHENREWEPANSEIYEVSLADGEITALTDRHGPDLRPVLSPDATKIAYLGNDERYQGYDITRLYVMDRDGSNPMLLSGDFDRSVNAHVWKADGTGVYFQYDDEGNTKIAFMSLDGHVQDLARDVGGLSLGRPYGAGQFSVAGSGRFAFTQSRPSYPADLAVGEEGPGDVRRITHLNDDLFAGKELAEVEEIWYESSFDGRRIQGWIATPPGFDPSKKYPLILEIHGGPFANYGNRFAAEVQLMAAAGYVVLYTNPRGSSSYGHEFGNLIHHNYPSQDYDDLMSGVDAVVARGFIDTDRLFVTGGSGGGVLSAWIVGTTDRFAAAVVAKPVINWVSFSLTADLYPFFTKYWFPGPPWEHFEHYMKRSPLSLVGNVSTPTMVLTGEEDYRTPMAESEQYYQALKLRRIDTVLVRIPGASHGIGRRPSQLIAKVAHVLKWFEMYGGDGTEHPASAE